MSGNQYAGPVYETKRRPDCVNYDGCLTAAAIENQRLICEDCPRYAAGHWRETLTHEEVQRCETLAMVVGHPEIEKCKKGITWDMVLKMLNERRDRPAHVLNGGRAVVGRASGFWPKRASVSRRYLRK